MMNGVCLRTQVDEGMVLKEDWGLFMVMREDGDAGRRLDR
jgi:hypothetical protein